MRLSLPLLLTLALAWVIPHSSHAQDTGPAADLSQQEMQARRDSIEILTDHISERYQRMQGIIEDIQTLDDRVESGVEKIVARLSKVKDSPETRVFVSKIKGDVIAGLKRSIEYYQRDRQTIAEQLRLGRSNLPAETLESDLAAFDARIEKRVGQIADLVSSFVDPQDVEKYVTSHTGYFGWSFENVAISDEWRQNRRDTLQTRQIRDQVAESIRESIRHLEDRNAFIREALRRPTISEAERNFYEVDLERNADIIAQRKQHLDEMLSSPSTATDQLDRSRAHELNDMIESARVDLRSDFFTMFRKYHELNTARAELKRLEDNLAARKEWLEIHDTE
jgi:hypothetical protein